MSTIIVLQSFMTLRPGAYVHDAHSSEEKCNLLNKICKWIFCGIQLK